MILGIDTSASRCAVALFRPDLMPVVLAERMDRGHAERLFPMIREVLAETGQGIDAVERIAVCTGPGSFTGLRVGVAAARGLALGRGIPAIGVTRFAALAATFVRPQGLDENGDRSGAVTMPRTLEEKVGWAERRPLAVAIAGRGAVYLQLFEAGTAITEPALIAPDALAATVPADAVPVGDGWAMEGVDSKGPGGRGEPVLLPEGLPDPVLLATLGAEAVPGPPPAPLYLRGADADPPREAPPRLLN
ncbi:MAG: tRNA (adenosine(37)-N6)-threonylcarbamoyltransferase complex dimerization subunit type 1 TsaB [Pseudomonadota bacterium]